MPYLYKSTVEKINQVCDNEFLIDDISAKKVKVIESKTWSCTTC